MNGYDAYSAVFARPGRLTMAEASGDSRSDGKASQTRDGSNRYDTSTPERRRKALAAARRSGNPADEEKVRKQINQEANSTIDALMLGLSSGPASRDNRARRQGGYRSPSLAVHESADDKPVDEASDGRDLPPWMKDKMDEARGGKGGNLPPWLRDKEGGEDSGSDDSGSDTKKKGKRGKVAESALNPQIRFRETVTRDGLDEAELTTKKRKSLGKGQFALPGERYPIPDESHARNALSRVSQNGTPEEIAKVRAAVKRKFPGIDVSGGSSK